MAVTELPKKWVSIDPGDRHVGFASWEEDRCLHAVELTPDQCIKVLEARTEARDLDTIVYEKFALYGWNEKSMAGNEFLTSQLIGIIKYIAIRHNIPCVGQFASEHKRIYRMGWYKSLTLKDKRQLPWSGNGDHAKDAWCVGMWFKRQREQS